MSSSALARPLLRLLAAATSVAFIAACGIAEDLDNRNAAVTSVQRPRVALLSGDVAALSYESHLTGGNTDATRLLLTRLYSIAGDKLEPAVSYDAFDPSFTPTRTPIAMSDGRDGYALSVVAGDLVVNGDNMTTFTSRKPFACVQRPVGASECVGLQLDAGNGAAVTHTQGGKSFVLFGPMTQLKQRTYDPAIGWQAIGDGPALPEDTQDVDDRSLVFGSSGSMFLAGFAAPTASSGAALAVRFDSGTQAWQPVDRLGAAAAPPKIALHPDAPGGNPIAVWQAPSGGIVFSDWLDAGGWQPSLPIPGSTGDAGQPAVAMWPNGDVLVLWVDGPSAASRNVVAARRIAGVWQAQETVGPTFETPRRLALGVDRFGNAVAAWANIGSIMSASLVVGDGWQPAAAIGFLADLNGSADLDVAMEPGGRAVAVWAEPAGGGQAGSQLKVASVGPSVLALTAQRYAFGGDPVALTVRLAIPPTQATTLALTSTLPAAQLGLPASVPVAANQSEVTLAVPSFAVNDFVSGRIDVVYGTSSASQPVTLMPEPTGVSVAVAPATVLGGETATVTVRLEPTYPTPLVVQFASTNPVLALVPAQLTAAASTSTATLQVTTTPTFATQSAVFTASFRGRVGSASLTIDPTAPGTSTLNVAVNLLIGNVVSNPAGINCGSTASFCVASYPVGTQVSLTPSATVAGQRFLSWQGDPDCSDGLLTMTAGRNCLAVFLPQPPSYPGSVSWTFLGTPLLGGNSVDPQPALALDVVTPVIAYVSAVAGAPAQLFVRRLEVSTFALLGTAALNVDPTKSAREPAIATTPNGLPFVAWIEGSGAQQNLYVSRLNFGTGLTWGAVGPAGVPLNYSAGSRASSPSIALDAELRPMVAWIEDGAVKFKRFDGTAWVAASGGEGPASSNADRVRLSSFSLAAGVADPVLAWTQGSGMTRALKAARDFAFTPLGTQVNPASMSPLNQFAVLAENGGAVVSWGLGDAPFTVRSQRWDGAAWVDVYSGPLLAGADPASHMTAIAMPKGALTVATLNTGPVAANGTGLLVALRQSGGGWAPPLSFPFLGDATLESLAVELAADNSPVVVVVRRNAAGDYRWDLLRYFP